MHNILPYGVVVRSGLRRHHLWWVFHYPYMEWYRRITRHLITPPLHRDQMGYHSTVAASQLLVRFFNL